VGRQNQIQTFFLFPGFWPNPGPGRVPLDSVRGDVEFAGVVTSVAYVAVNFVPEFIFWNMVEKN